MKPGFTTLGCPDWTIEQIAKFSGANNAGIELRFHDDGNHSGPKLTPDAWKAQADVIGSHGGHVFCLMAYSRFADPAKREENVTIGRKAIEAAGVYGASFIRFFVGKIPDGMSHDDVLPGCQSALKTLCAEAADHNVSLCIETHDDWCIPANIMNLFDAVGAPNLKICWDICNAHHAGTPVAEAFPLLKDVIGYCHVKDGVNKTVNGDSKWTYVRPGEGDVALTEALALMKKAGYDSYFSFEHEKKWHPELEDPQTAFPNYLAWFARTAG